MKEENTVYNTTLMKRNTRCRRHSVQFVSRISRKTHTDYLYMYTKHVFCVHTIRKFLSNIHQSNRYNDTLNVKRSQNLRAKVALEEDKQFVLILYAFNNITMIKIVKEIKSMVPIIILTRRKANRYRNMRIEEQRVRFLCLK